MTVHLAGCVIIKDHALLLLHRPKKAWYELPGGKVEQGESKEQAAVRECKEELACDVTLINVLGEKSFQEENVVMHYTWFQAKIDDEQIPHIGEPETFDSLIYIPLSSLATYSLSPNMKNLLNEVTRGTVVLS